MANGYLLAKALIFSNFFLQQNTTILRESCQYYADFSIAIEDLVDTGEAIRNFSGKSRRQCTLECMSNLQCKSLNFKENGGHCQLLDRNLTTSAQKLGPKSGWVYMTTDENQLNVGSKCKMMSPCQNGGKCVDTCTEASFKCTCTEWFTGKYCENEKAFTSCHALYKAGYRKDGVYLLSNNIGYHYCVLNGTIGCNAAGGYTLALITDGRLNTFQYDANYWTSSNEYNQVFALRKGLDGDEEVKFNAFNMLPFTSVCLGMKVGMTRNFLSFGHSSTSLLDYFKTNVYKQTIRGRSAWLGLIKDSTVQSNCNREGFNNILFNNKVKVRIGIFGNNENNCLTPDSVLGIGIGGSSFLPLGIYTGATMSGKKAYGYLLIK